VTPPEYGSPGDTRLLTTVAVLFLLVGIGLAVLGIGMMQENADRYADACHDQHGSVTQVSRWGALCIDRDGRIIPNEKLEMK
jgi:hypothetical protein